MIVDLDIAFLNKKFQFEKADAIIKVALKIASNPLVTTSFGGHSAAILHSVSRIDKDIQVVWCDTGHNTKATYEHADLLIDSLQLNIEIFKPQESVLVSLGLEDVKEKLDSDYTEFAKHVKLEPFERAMNKYQPDVWFTNVRRNQSAYRNTLDIFSLTKDNVLRVSPFYYYNDNEIIAYLETYKLPIEYDYYDPLKLSRNKECGIQLRT
jgi:phosphoadenosine phosphosulfate reductase